MKTLCERRGKVAVIDLDWTAISYGSPPFGNHGFSECIRGSEMMDATMSIITREETMLVSLPLASLERNLRGKNSNSIPIGCNGTELFV